MDAAYLSALSALSGSAIGALASLGTTWLTQRYQDRNQTFVREVVEQSTSRQMVVDQRGLPAGVQRLLALAAAVPEQEAARHRGAPLPWLDGIGTAVLSGWQGAWDILGFIGETVLAGLRLMAGQARFRRVDLALFLQQCGAQALGIVTLVSFLVGLILAFVGAVQLRQLRSARA